MISYRSYLKSRFGGNVLKIPLNAGFSCPNRNGAKGVGGCVFCDNRAFSPAHDKRLIPPADQLRDAVYKYGGKYKLFLPYLQPSSNTYAPADKLRDVYESLISVDGVVGLAVGTRPDCFDEEIYRYLGDLGKRTYLSMELGLQSGHDIILERMNRQHTVRDFMDAVYRLDGLGIETVAHIILGFPGETGEMVEETAAMLSSLPLRGVKIHQLMIVESTPLAEMYRLGDLQDLTIDEYAELLRRFIKNLREDIHIHRIAADSRPEYGLIAPMWSLSERKLETVEYLKDKIGAAARRGRVVSPRPRLRVPGSPQQKRG